MGFLSSLFAPRPPPVMPVHVDARNFSREVLHSDLPVVLDVWGPGCSPCKMLEPIVMSVAARYQGRVKVAEMNAAESGALASQLGVMSTPTLLFFKGRREVDRVSGFVGEMYIREIVESDLLEPPGG